MFPFFFQPEKADRLIRIRFMKISGISMRAAQSADARITGKEGQRRLSLPTGRMCVEIHMPQDVYIYDPNVPVPYKARHVEIPKGVTVIREDAFRNCSDLQSVTIPDGVTKIDQYAFRGCSGLQSIVIPDSVTEIVAGAFWGCAGLQSVTIPDGVTEIGNHVFAYCVRLQSVTIPDSVTEIGISVFDSCSRLQSVTISRNIKKIAPHAFDNCFELQSVVIRDGVTEIGTKAFHNCKSLQSVTIPDSITKIGNYAFEDCSALLSVTIPDGVTEIGYGAFRGCSSFQSITIPDGVPGVKDHAFQNCTALQSVTLPDSVTEIGYKAFDGCSNLQSVTIPDSVIKIGDYAFDGCSGLVTITIPESVTKIEEGTFYACSGLRSIVIPNGITGIGEYAFWSCSSLQSVIIPDSVTEIGNNAFDGCPSLVAVTISKSVTEIREGTFYACSGLRSIVIPDSVTYIVDYAFDSCSGLQSVTIPDGITEIGFCAFKNCSALQTLLYKGVNIVPFISIGGYGVNTFSVIKTLVDHRIPLNKNTVRRGIDMAHRDGLAQWTADYPVFGEMRLSSVAKSVDGKTEDCLRRLFATQKKTGCHIPKILDKLAIAVCVCGIPLERLAETFDIRYTEAVIRDGVPAVPAEVCRCYYDRGTCNMLIQKDRISVMAEAIGLYNKSGHQECYRHLMDFIRSHPDTRTEDLQYAVDNAEKIPMRAGITLTQIRQHRTYMENLAEVTKIEEEYGEIVPGFKLSDYPCNIAPGSVTYDGMTARVLNLSDEKDIALATRLGELTNCCQCLGGAGETAMMHGFLNPDAGFWVIEDKDGTVKAQAEIWEADKGVLVFDNIEFADTDSGHRAERINQLRGVIAAWTIESGYTNIIMGCGYNELGIGSMEPAPIPELCLTPEEVFALQEGNNANVSFRNTDEVRRYMQIEEYDPDDFVYTDAGEQCVYIKKDGIVSGYLMQGYNRSLADKHPASGHETTKEQEDDTACK